VSNQLNPAKKNSTATLLASFGATAAGILIGILAPLQTAIPAKLAETWIATVLNFEIKHSIALAMFASIAILLKIVLTRPSGKEAAILYFFLGLCLSWPLRR
jgi:hypothetical protein